MLSQTFPSVTEASSPGISSKILVKASESKIGPDYDISLENKINDPF